MTAQMLPARGSLGSRVLVLALAGAALCPRVAQAGNGGEGRSVLRDADRPYGVVAGEADASAVVQNPANLAYLAGFNAVVDFAASLRTSGRRGDGLGMFAAVPLPWQILALGVGVQAMWRTQVTGGGTIESADDPFGKFTIAAALPLMRWAPGLALGAQYSRLFSGNNELLSPGVNQFDLALSWRANRYLSVALVARNLNAPRLGSTGARVLPVLDPEIALRPFGDPRLEFAFGMRTGVAELRSDGSGGVACNGEPQIRGCALQPRARVLGGTRGVRVYAEAEGVGYFDETGTQGSLALRVSAGLQFDTPHFGLAAGPTFGAPTSLDGPHGVNGRIRMSHERYTDVLPMRPRQVELGGQRFTTQGNWELFVARFAPDGTHVWSRGMGSPADDELRGIALDGAGNLYITGSMHGGALVEGNMLPGFAGDDLLVAKYTVDGQHVWSNLYGSIGDEVGYDVAVDAEGGPVISGSFSGETNLGAGPVMAVGADDVFLLRLDPGGAPLWSKTAGSGDPQDDFGWAVAVFPGSGDILFGGAFRQTINLGGADLVADSRLDMFLARYTAAGDHVWSMSAGSGADDDVYGLDIDGDGNILLAGRSGSTVNFGTTPLGGIGQAIAAKLDGDGNGLWVRHSEGAPFQEDYATCMAVAAGPAGEVFVAGYVDGDINLGDTPDTEVGGAEIETFITKLDPDGAHEWSRAYGEDDNDYSWAVAAGADGQAIYGGALNSFEGRMFMTMFGASG